MFPETYAAVVITLVGCYLIFSNSHVRNFVYGTDKELSFTLYDAARGQDRKVECRVLVEGGGRLLSINPSGYGECDAYNGQGSPVLLEIWDDNLRLVVFKDINSPDPTIIDLEGARENKRFPPDPEDSLIVAPSGPRLTPPPFTA